MKIGIYKFDPQKNQILKQNRGISFEEVISAINDGYLVDTLEHQNKHKYLGQYIYAVKIDGYIYTVPFIEEKNGDITLKTIFPSRKLTKRYITN